MPHSYQTDPKQQHYRCSDTRQSLWIALALTSSFMLAEVVGGLTANSLALLADTGHMVTDAVFIGLALLAIWVATRPASASRTFGFQRTEVLAALLNAISLVLFAVWIFFEAYRRLLQPSEVRGILTLTVGIAGLLVNLGVAWVLKRSAERNLNVEGAFLHVLGDLLGSIGVVAAAILIIAFGWFIADPIFGLLIGVLVLVSSGRLLWKVLHVLMEGTPAGLDVRRICQRLEQVPGVTGVHDIHAWSVTKGYDVLNAHVGADPTTGEEGTQLLQQLRNVVAKEFGIAHVTIQLERPSPDGCVESYHITHDADLAGYSHEANGEVNEEQENNGR
ncbi:MAG: cation transporter [Dehalococcoidia bacterium]|nr:cation transporter [Dehalococcoidia bacterium]